MTQAEIDQYRAERDLLYSFEAKQVGNQVLFRPLGWAETYGRFPAPPFKMSETQGKCAALCFMNESGFSNSTAYYDHVLARVTNADIVKIFGHICDIQISKSKRNLL